MNIKTSYFAKYDGDNSVSIALSTPKWHNCKRSYSPLFPKWSFLNKYKKDGDKLSYTKEYYFQVLQYLDPYSVLKVLDGSVLLCWEKPDKFCHRHIFRNWIKNETGCKIEEIK